MIESQATQCEDELRRAIVRGSLRPGDRLPPERTLAVQLGVERGTVRTALARLGAAGLVQARQGSGYEVLPWLHTSGPDLLPDLLALAGDELPLHAADLLRARRGLARAVLETLVERPPSADARTAIDRRIDALEALVRGRDVDALANADLDVVTALLDATGSATLQLCTSPVAAVLGAAPELRDAIYADAAQSVAGWRALSAWIAAPDAASIDVVIGAMAERDRQTVARLTRKKRR